jgi:hypothetical protein
MYATIFLPLYCLSFFDVRFADYPSMLRHDLIYFSDISSSTKFSYTIVLTISVLILCGYRWKYTWSEGDTAKYQNIGFLPSQRMLNNASYSIEYLNKPRVKHKICPMFICGACGTLK